MNKYFIFCFVIFFSSVIELSGQTQNSKISNQYFKMPAGIHQEQYLPKTIILKIKDQYKKKSKGNVTDISELTNCFNKIQVENILQKFPEELNTSTKGVQFGRQIDLSSIYEITYNNEIDLEKAINQLYETGVVQYAVPHYLPHLLYTPDDSNVISKQWGLAKIQAFAGWDISKGDTNTVIGIVDTGVQLDHPDLKDNLKYNYNDPIDGKDNDNDGYVDNFRGWDLGQKDNNPTANFNYHGIHVAGIAAASTDNGKGIAGVGFKCKFLPVKIDSLGKLIKSYEGIKYAADHGCSIINCSWGDTINPGQYAQDIIDYATFNKNALVVAAAGNDSNNKPYYPASLNHVLSVAASNSNDEKASFSNYGINVDVCAPGDNIYSTWENGTYVFLSGTSMAAPFASGVAAIVKSYFPTYNALQVAEQVKVTAELIDTVKKNTPYAQQLGAGRINLYRALTIKNLPSVRMITDSLPLSTYQFLTQNDTLKFNPYFINFLSPTKNLKVSITTSSPYVKIIDSVIDLGIMATKAVISSPKQIRIQLLSNIPSNYNLQINFKFTDDNYSATQSFKVFLNVDLLNVYPNNIATTLTSTGDFGYNDYNQTQGAGFFYKEGNNLLSCAGIVVGNSKNNLSDNIYSKKKLFSNDFFSTKNIRQIPSSIADFEYYGEFNNRLINNKNFNIEIQQRTYAWKSLNDANYMIFEYQIKNISSSPLIGLFAGLYTDWDIWDTANRNRTNFDTINSLGYTYNIDGVLPYCGTALLTPLPYKFYAADNKGSNGSVSVLPVFTDSSKYIALSNNRFIAGSGSNGSDVSQILSVGPFNLDVNKSKKIAFIVLAGDSIADLKNSVNAARIKYQIDTITDVKFLNNNIQNNIQMQIYPNPSANEMYISIDIPTNSQVDLGIYNITGEKIMTLANSKFTAGTYLFKLDKNLSEGYYICRLATSNSTITKKIIKLK